MEWRDEGLIIGVRRHGERSAIVEAMTRALSAPLERALAVGQRVRNPADCAHV
jgi:recombinational DNA repair protein (RecF pathway)